MQSYRVINKLDSSKDLNKDILVKFDAGILKDKKYGEATLSGQFLLINRHGEFPEVNVKQIEERALTWLNEMGLMEHHDEIFKKMNLPCMTAYTTPDTNPNKLDLFFKTAVFMFLFDDAQVTLKQLNGDNVLKHQDDMLRLVKSLFSILESHGNGSSAVFTASANPMFESTFISLSQVCRESFKQLSKDEYSHFARELEDYIRVNKWEQEYRSSCSKNDFLFLRSVNVGMSPLLYLLCLAKDIRISNEVKLHPLFQRYNKNAFMQVALSNDILSLKKEIANDDVEQNFVIHKYRKYSLQKSFRKAEEATNKLMIDLKKDAMKLKLYFPTDHNLKNFVQTMEYMVDGFLYWHLEATRYGNIKYETYVVEYDSDYNGWLKTIGIINEENMEEPVLRLESSNGTAAISVIPPFPTSKAL